MSVTVERAAEILAEMRELVERAEGDAEGPHADGDALLLEIVRAYGHNEIADAFEAMRKWYA
jgi:hypothetical protein